MGQWITKSLWIFGALVALTACQSAKDEAVHFGPAPEDFGQAFTID